MLEQDVVAAVPHPGLAVSAFDTVDTSFRDQYTDLFAGFFCTQHVEIMLKWTTIAPICVQARGDRRSGRSNDEPTLLWLVGRSVIRGDGLTWLLINQRRVYWFEQCNQRNTGSFLDPPLCADIPRSPRALNTLQAGDGCTPH